MFPETTEISFMSAEQSDAAMKNYLFDFEAGDFVVRDGKLVVCDGLEALKVWIEKILRTEKGRFAIYDGTSYGCQLEDLIVGNSYTSAFIESELKREIEDALAQNPHIVSVYGIKLSREKNAITIELEVKFGDTGGNIVTVTV